MSRTVEFLVPDGPLTDEVLGDVVSLVDHEPPPALELELWTDLERVLVYDWAMREHMRAAGNRVKRRPKPWVLQRAEGSEMHQEVVDRGTWLDATKNALDAVTLERNELRARVAALESQLKTANAGEFEQAGPDDYEPPDDESVH